MDLVLQLDKNSSDDQLMSSQEDESVRRSYWERHPERNGSVTAHVVPVDVFWVIVID